MKLKYINQLTDAELKELFIKFAQSHCGLFVNEYSRGMNTNDFIHLNGLCSLDADSPLRYAFPIEWAFNDYDVYVYNEQSHDYVVVYSFEDDYRKYMRSKFEDQYARDCFWYDLDED